MGIFPTCFTRSFQLSLFFSRTESRDYIADKLCQSTWTFAQYRTVNTTHQGRLTHDSRGHYSACRQFCLYCIQSWREALVHKKKWCIWQLCFWILPLVSPVTFCDTWTSHGVANLVTNFGTPTSLRGEVLSWIHPSIGAQSALGTREWHVAGTAKRKYKWCNGFRVNNYLNSHDLTRNYMKC